MFFWKKKNTVTIDCFTFRESCYRAFRVDKASKFFPTWWKQLGKGNYTDSSKPPSTTMKSCEGFIDYFTNSIAIPLWDYFNFLDKDGAVEYTKIDGDINSVHSHPRPQFEGFLDHTYYQYKIIVPWTFIADSKVKFLQTFPTWCYYSHNTPDRIMHLPGVLDFYYQRTTNFNMFIKASSKGSQPNIISMEPGIPLMFFTPLENITVKLKHHLVSKSEYEQKSLFALTSHGPHRRKLLKQAIDFTDKNKKSCPFGFGKNK